MTHPAIRAGNTALITGGGSGIGLASARLFAGAGMSVVLVDLGRSKLEAARGEVLAAGAPEVAVHEVDVRDRAALGALAGQVVPDVLMANAGIGPESGVFGPAGAWEDILGVNLWGMIHTVQAFGPGMQAKGGPGAVICTGSKQGITTPPGNPAYNISKAGVKAFAEALAHHFRSAEGCEVTAHLLIPGFVYTPLTRPGGGEKPSGAWTADQTAAFMAESLSRGDFYILCPDNDVPRSLDEKRIAWAAGDIIENRPALSRWHPDWGKRFEDWLKR